MRRNVPFLVKLLAIIGFGILYVPVIMMMIYSFNKSKLVSVWAGFSTKWYKELWTDDILITALYKSVLIGISSATISTIFGLLIAIAFVRFASFRGRLFLSLVASAPLVMPEAVTGLSMLLLFIAMEASFGWPSGRGIDTIMIAHATFGMCFAAVVIQTRLRDMDKSLEEAARDLGGRQPFVFLSITFPLILPSIIAAWLLSFTLSFDDLVIASFVSGPGSSTLPIVIFSKIRLGVSPEINAVATLMILSISAFVILGSLLVLRRDGKK
ncbi:ABC transporter permease subunit [Alphaproteobacteria bacterium]|jgi:putrescine transport system permease protein|nr:ABC transporter permease subunit [Alphaproteobacteria bacterium]MBT5799728.1 ABC transporter permease subunit [Alphaproteobacteria bacterium]MDA9190544.1 ABC transporter permease subunit [Alphaproteobacteria bacterium]